MSKMMVVTIWAVLTGLWPLQAMAALEADKSTLLRAYLEEKGSIERVTPASSRFSIHIGPYGTFAYGRFGGRGYYRGNKGYHPYRPYKFGRYYGNRYDYKPYLRRHDRFKRDPFFYDRRSRLDNRDFWSPYYSPFGTRRPGW